MKLRKATPDDSKRLFDWRNDELTRQNSRNTDPVPWDGHQKWFESTLVNPQLQLLVAERDGVPVGVVRFDVHDDFHEVSWTVAPDSRGRGYGKEMVSAALATVSSQKVFAEIKPTNKPSRSIAAASGFKLVGVANDLERWEKS